MTRPTQAEIISPALKHNLALIYSQLRLYHSTARVIAVVKADAYGHGAVMVSRALVEAGVRDLAVACLEEALELHEAGIDARIIILGPLRADEVGEAAKNGLTVLVSCQDDLKILKAVSSGPFAGKLSVILKVDTGMGRIGFFAEDVFEVHRRLRELNFIELAGIFTHFSRSESESPEDLAYTRRQMDDFGLVVSGIRKTWPELSLVSMANSAAIFNINGSAGDAVRTGIMLYGVRPDDGVAPAHDLQPVMRLVTEVVQVRDLPAGACISYGRKTILQRPSKIAVLPIGYADGLQRRLPPGFEFFTSGRPAPLAGVVTMDLTMIDVTDIPSPHVGDRVLIMGRDRQSGAAVEVRAERHAQAAGTIPYEILTSVGKRVRRIRRMVD